MADGLGHGEHAEKAAKAAIDYVAHHLSEPVTNIFADCGLALRDMRGVAMGIAVINKDAERLTYVGVGNIRAMIIGEQTLRLGSNYGIVGGGYKTLSPETVLIMPGDLVIMATDGVSERMDVSGYDEARRGDIQRLAEKILQDWGIETDDASVLVFRNKVT